MDDQDFLSRKRVTRSFLTVFCNILDAGKSRSAAADTLSIKIRNHGIVSALGKLTMLKSVLNLHLISFCLSFVTGSENYTIPSLKLRVFKRFKIKLQRILIRLLFK